MPRYQIRTPENQYLEELVSGMALEALDTILKNLNSEKTSETLRADFISHLQKFLTPHLEAFDLCGTSCECSDDVEGAPWLEYNDNIYHLVLPGSMSAFAKDLAMDSLQFLKPALKPDQMEKAFVILERIFRRTINDHLYHNPVCRKAEICKGAVSVSPWRRN